MKFDEKFRNAGQTSTDKQPDVSGPIGLWSIEMTALGPVGRYPGAFWCPLRGVAFARLLGELDAIARQGCAQHDPERESGSCECDKGRLREDVRGTPKPSCDPPCPRLDDGKLTGPINAHKEIELAFHRLNLGDVRSRACKHALSGSGYGRNRWDFA